MISKYALGLDSVQGIGDKIDERSIDNLILRIVEGLGFVQRSKSESLQLISSVLALANGSFDFM